MKKTQIAIITLAAMSMQYAWAETQSYTMNELLSEQKLQLKNGDELQLSDEDGELGTMNVTAVRFNGNRTQISVTLNQNGLIYPGSVVLINHQSAIYSRQTASGVLQTNYSGGQKTEHLQKQKAIIENNDSNINPLNRMTRPSAQDKSSIQSKIEASTPPIVFSDDVIINSGATLKPPHRHNQIKMAVVYDNPTKELLANQGISDIYPQLSLIQSFFDASNTNTEIEFIPIHFDGEFPVGSSTGNKELEYAMSESKEFADMLLSAEPDFIHTISNNNNGDFGGVAYYGIQYDSDIVGNYVQPARLSLGLTKANYFAGGLVSAHEIGHQLGLKHDRYTLANNQKLGAGGSQYDYAIPYGYDNPDGGFYTIMSYGEECRIKSIKGCQWLGLFSNAQQQYSGFYTGVDEQYVEAANSAKWLRMVHNDVAVRKNNPVDIQVIHEEDGVRYIWPDVAEQYALVTNLCDELDNTDIAASLLNSNQPDGYRTVILGDKNSAWLSNENIGYPTCISLYALSKDIITDRNIVTKLADLPSPAHSFAVNNGVFSQTNVTLNATPMALQLPKPGQSQLITVTLDGNYQSYDPASAQLLARLPQSCDEDVSYCPAWPATYPRTPEVSYPTLFSDLLGIETNKLTDNQFTIKITNKATSIEQWRRALLDLMRKQGLAGIEDPIIRNRIIPIKIESYFKTSDVNYPYDFENRQAVLSLSFDNLIPEGSLLGNYIQDHYVHTDYPLTAHIQSSSDDVLVYINGSLTTVTTEVSGNTIKIYGLNDIIGANAKADLTIVRGESSISAKIESLAKFDVGFESQSYSVSPGSVLTIIPTDINNILNMRIVSAPDYVTIFNNQYLNVAPDTAIPSGNENIEIEITDKNGYKSTHSLYISLSSNSTESKSSGGGSVNWGLIIFMIVATAYRKLKPSIKPTH